MDLFDTPPDSASRGPLAARMRPRSLEEIIGQETVLGPGRLLRRAIEADRLGSIILYGPPGCGKTSIAEVMASTTQREFLRTSGAIANVAELRDHIKQALFYKGQHDRGTILFVDEIHRFNKSQQDVLLPYVEDGTITLIGATTHNPMFFINSPLTSRSLIFELSPLSPTSVVELLHRAVKDERGFGDREIVLEKDAADHLAVMSEGDARRALNALEIAVLTTPLGENGVVTVTMQVAEDSVQKKAVLYDHDEDGHYDTISAFIKSVRGSDPNAAVYWLAKMLYAGEDPRFVARRLVILASEDIGNADPRGLTLAVSAMHAVEFVGMPEARIILSQATTYLATAPKSNAAYLAVSNAEKDVKEGRVLEVPDRLKNKKVRSVGKKFEEYHYPHDYSGHFVDQEYVPTTTVYYEATEQGYEDIIKKRMEKWEAARKKSGKDD